MRFIDTIITLVAVLCTVLSAYFVGHALSSEHGGWAWGVAAGLLAIGLLVGAFAARRLKRSPPPTHEHGAH